jgi:hypothetical protein
MSMCDMCAGLQSACRTNMMEHLTAWKMLTDLSDVE